MRFLILTDDYPDFLRWLYDQHPGLSEEPYEKQLQIRLDSLFAGPHVYSINLRALGHEVEEIYWNNDYLETAWARENGLRVKAKGEWEFRLRRGYVPWVSRVRNAQRRLYEILAERIKRFKPDILFNQAMDTISGTFITEMKSHARFLMGQHAAPLPADFDFGSYDLLLSSLPDLVDRFRRNGVRAELNRLAFDPRWLSCRESEARPFDVTFIGNLFHVHSGRVALLEALCSRLPQLKVWAPSTDRLPEGSAIRRAYQGPAWGRDMYRILASSKITINNHGDFAPYANNARLYEATGMGALLLTDWKENLPDLFEPGEEVVVYQSADECAEMVAYFLTHDDRRRAIAAAGQRRAQVDHTYAQRVGELVDIVARYA